MQSNSLFNVLAADLVPRIELPLDEPVAVKCGGADLGLTVEAFPVPGKVALYLEDANAGQGFGTQVGDTLALKVSAPATGKHFFYIPGCASVNDDIRARVQGAPLVFFDGTLYTDDEMLVQGLMPKTGNRMGHISISGPEGSIATFRDLGVARKIYVHINNSNPVLDELLPSAALPSARVGRWDSTEWRSSYERARQRITACGAWRSSKRRSAPSAPSATTTSIRSITCCTAAS